MEVSSWEDHLSMGFTCPKMEGSMIFDEKKHLELEVLIILDPISSGVVPAPSGPSGPSAPASSPPASTLREALGTAVG
jgi:hypothetical protein